MHSQSPLKTTLATCSILSLAPRAFAHMQMIWPYALRSSYNPANNYQNIDYSMTAPLVADGSNFPCKGYQNDRPIDNVVTYTAGSTYNMSLAGSATHGGGSCQLSLSYDNGGTFRVIQSMIGGCPLASTYDFTIPSYVPAGQALFAWSWQNLVGNREYYMNCAEVEIVASTTSKRDGSSAFSSFEDLPFIWKANLDGLNNCTTIEGDVPVYPEPGPAVIYGTGATSSSAASSNAGVCELPKPFGQTYEYLDDTVNASTEVFGSTTASSSATSTHASSATTTSASKTTTLVTSSKVTSTSSSSSSRASSTSKSSTLSTTTKASTTSSKASPSSSTLSTATKASTTSGKASSSSSTSSSIHSSSVVTLSTAGAGRLVPTTTTTCPPDVTLTVYADESTTTTGFATSTKIATTAGTGSSVSTVLGFSTVSSSTILVVSAASSSTKATTSKATSSITSSAAGAEVTEGYATGDLATYLPCVPGTFICTSDESWVTCDDTMYSDGSTAWIYEYNRTVSSGMECVPNLSPYSSSTKKYAQQADAPSGYYRDDRIVAAQTYGTCSTEGDFECTDNGDEFLVCDNGAWVMMGAVAAGTTCKDGAIVASS